MLGAGGAKEKTYMDDVFSTYLYSGNASAQGTVHQIVNGINNNEHGGMVWIKARGANYEPMVLDSVRVGTGGTYELYSNNNAAQAGPYSGYNITAFNTNGFKLEGNGSLTNSSGNTYSSWNFRQAPGFFDIVQYTGNGSNRTIAHSLGCVPGFMMVKRLENAANWACYHRGAQTTGAQLTQLNDSGAAFTANDIWNNTAPTSTHFSVGTSGNTNNNGETYIAYLFAGGESTAATARSVEFDGSNDYLNTNTSTDYDLGTGDFTAECWVYPKTNSSWKSIADKRNSSGDDKFLIYLDSSALTHRKVKFYSNGADRISSGDYDIKDYQWNHVAVVRSSGNTRLYVNGTQVGSTYSDSNDYDTTQLYIGATYSGAQSLDGSISNFRLVKGTAVYTSAFRPPTEPLTSISGTVLLCCNNSSITGSTTGTVTSSGDPAASTDSPFDDPAAFKFGENGDQGIVKCGSYEGSGNATAGPEVYLGWEPQWVMIKSLDSTDDWIIWDSMRGIVTGYNDPIIRANLSNGEATDTNHLSLTSTGFKLTSNDGGVNSSNTYSYIAIRRPDGYVGKPAEVGTDVFDMDTASSSYIPNFDSGFPVDFALARPYASTNNWYVSSRLTQARSLLADLTTAEGGQASFTFDSNKGWDNATWGSTALSWMWKRHAGFDVVTYTGNNVKGRQVPHSLNKTVEMVWIKKRDETGNWIVGHKGMNGGTNPWQYSMQLDSTDAATDNEWAFNDTAPTSTAITLGDDGNCNGPDKTYLMMLFASVDGISKVGSYIGNGSSTERTITLGFQPRFLVVKRDDSTTNWNVLDTARGWGSGNDKRLYFDGDWAQSDNLDIGAPTSNGFTLTTDIDPYNTDTKTYLYYAHA